MHISRSSNGFFDQSARMGNAKNPATPTWQGFSKIDQSAMANASPVM
jgi:hypothetical protein